MIDKKELICIVCPNSCLLEVEIENGDITGVRGALCDRGVIYAQNELLNPLRNLTTTVKVKRGEFPLVSVRSEREIPRGIMAKALNILKEIEAQAPVAFHQIIAKDILGTGIDIIATREVKEAGN